MVSSGSAAFRVGTSLCAFCLSRSSSSSASAGVGRAFTSRVSSDEMSACSAAPRGEPAASFRRRRGGTGAVSTALIIPVMLSRLNGERPSNSEYRVTPRLHRSEAGSARSPSNLSGAMYSGEPMYTPVWVSAALPWTLAIPKSISTVRSSSVSMMLAGLTSRWVTPTACAAFSPPSNALAASSTRSAGMGPCASMWWCREEPLSSSMTIHGLSSCSRTSWTVTMALWWIRAVACASRSVRACASTRSSSLMPSGSRTSLTATSRCRIGSNACQTVPIPPEPRRPRSS